MIEKCSTKIESIEILDSTFVSFTKESILPDFRLVVNYVTFPKSAVFVKIKHVKFDQRSNQKPYFPGVLLYAM